MLRVIVSVNLIIYLLNTIVVGFPVVDQTTEYYSNNATSDKLPNNNSTKDSDNDSIVESGTQTGGRGFVIITDCRDGYVAVGTVCVPEYRCK